MTYRIAWSGLSDLQYWKNIAQYCVPSWKDLPGDKFLITDFDLIEGDINIIKWNEVADVTQGFPVKFSKSNKQTNFWRKMKSQVWAIKNLKDYDFLILLDTDIETYNFNREDFFSLINQIDKENPVWSIGSSTNGIDAGFIIINFKNKVLMDLIDEYEKYWEEGHILSLPNGYDGDVVQDMIKTYQPLLIPNINTDFGQYYYKIGLYHWGSKISKPIRRSLINSSEYIKEKVKNI